MTATERPLRRDAERNRQRIIDAAREVFATQGIGAGLNEIAHHAGLAVGTVYRRFPDKDALVQMFSDGRELFFRPQASPLIDSKGQFLGVIVILMKRREWSSRMPYGPYIALAAAVWIFAGKEIVRAIFH